MTIKGKIFKSYAEEIVKRHGFGSNRMVRSCSTDFWTKQKESLGKMLKADPESAEALNAFAEMWEGEEYLLDNGYIRKYMPTWKPSRKGGQTHGAVYVGLTEKGWKIAQKYMEAEE